jgi:Zn-dependent protease with chaperone function
MRQELTSELFSYYLAFIIADEDFAAYCQTESLDTATVQKFRNSGKVPGETICFDIKYEERLLVYAYAFFYSLLKNDTLVSDRLRMLRSCLHISEIYNMVLRNFSDSYLSQLSAINPIDILINTPERLIEQIGEAILLHQNEGFYSEKNVLKGIPYESYEHPLDKAALQTLKGTPGLESMAKFIYQHGIDRVTKIQQRGSYYKVTKQNNERLWRILHTACEVLDIDDIPQLYLSNGHIGSAYTTGFDKNIINISTAMEAFFTTDELYFVIGHELGHIKSGHVLYHSMAEIFPVLVYAIPIPILNDILSESLKLSLNHWRRMSEFTCDRSGLLVCQNMEAAIRVFAKISGYPLFKYKNIDVDEFLAQSSEFIEFDQNKVDKTLKFILNMYDDHPWAIERSKRLFTWYDEGNYNAILSGNYVQTTNTLRGKSNAFNATDAADISERLLKLDDYYKKGLIDEQEFNERKKYLLTKF